MLAKALKRTSRESFWLGVVFGAALALGLGIAIGYDMGSDTVIVVPLEPGVDV